MTRTRAKKLRDKLAKEKERRAEAKKAVDTFDQRLYDQALYLLAPLIMLLIGIVVFVALKFLS